MKTKMTMNDKVKRLRGTEHRSRIQKAYGSKPYQGIIPEAMHPT